MLGILEFFSVRGEGTADNGTSAAFVVLHLDQEGLGTEPRTPCGEDGHHRQACAPHLGRESCGGRQKISEEYGNPQVKYLFCS